VWLNLPPHSFFICAEDFESPRNFVWSGTAAPPNRQPHNPAHNPLDTNRNPKPQDDAPRRPERHALCAASGPHLTCVQLARHEHPQTVAHRPSALDSQTNSLLQLAVSTSSPRRVCITSSIQNYRAPRLCLSSRIQNNRKHNNN
jgi:hypothetical protein